MSASGGKLGRKREEAIVALLSQRSIEEAARSIGVDPRTLYRWMKEPEFQVDYRKAKHAAFSQAIARLHQMSSAAATTLGKVMVDASTPPATKVRAAECILNHTSKAIEVEDIEERLAALERGADGGKAR